MWTPAQLCGATSRRRIALPWLLETPRPQVCLLWTDEARRPRRRGGRLLPPVLQPPPATSTISATVATAGRRRRAHAAAGPLPTGQLRCTDLPHLLRPRRATTGGLLPLPAEPSGNGPLADRARLPDLLHRDPAVPGRMCSLPQRTSAHRPELRRRRSLRPVRRTRRRLHLPAMRPRGKPLRERAMCLLRPRGHGR